MIQPEEVVKAIVKEQSQIIGASLARQVVASTGLVFYTSTGEQQLQPKQSPQAIISGLIQAYGTVFGQASINVCLDVINKFPKSEVAYLIPEITHAN